MIRIAHDATPQHRAAPTPALNADRARLLELLGGEGSDALTIAELRDRGVQMPGQAIYELELAGYPVERVRLRLTESHRTIGYRLGGPPQPPAA